MANFVKDMQRKPCGDCGCSIGENHVPGCDHERCPKCDMQLISCGCFVKIDENEVEEWDEQEFLKYEPEKWSGIYFEKEKLYCEEHNLWCYFGPDYGERGWIKCDKDHPYATHDLNEAVIRLHRKN